MLTGGIPACFPGGAQRGGTILPIGGGGGACPEGVLAGCNQAVDSLLTVVVASVGLLEGSRCLRCSNYRGIRRRCLGWRLGLGRCCSAFSSVVAGRRFLSLRGVLLWCARLLGLLIGVLLRLFLDQVRGLLRCSTLFKGGSLGLLVCQRLDRALGCAKLCLGLLGLALELLVLRRDLLQPLLGVAQRVHGGLVGLDRVLHRVIRGLAGRAQARLLVRALGARQV